MQLNGIAQKLKFKALQERAKEKIADIAESRELTVAELEDRLAPDTVWMITVRCCWISAHASSPSALMKP